MKRPRTLVREIMQTQERIAVLREDQARIGQEISHLIATNKTKVMELVGDAVGRLDLSQLPINDFLFRLSGLCEGVVNDRVLPNSPLAAEAKIEAFVKVSRNVSVSNRQVLESAGLPRHGGGGGGVCRGTPTPPSGPRRVFGERRAE